MDMGSLHGFQLLDFSHYNKPPNHLTQLAASQQTSLLAPLGGSLTGLSSGSSREESNLSPGAEGQDQLSVVVTSAGQQLHSQLASSVANGGGTHRQPPQSTLGSVVLASQQRQHLQQQTQQQQQANTNGGARKFECNVCHKSFKQLAHLNTHALLHEGKRPHKCSYCEQTFSQLTHLKRHLVTHRSHCADEPLRSASTYSCHLCPRRFAFPSDLNAHLNKHYNRRQRKPSSNRGSVGGNHSQRGGIGTVSNGQATGAGGGSSSALSNQKSSLPGVARYACGMCPRAFQYPSQLREHMYVHTHIRRFPCGECGRRFMKEHHLKVHQQSTHLCLRPHTCPVCHKTFSIKANLERHLFVHSGHKTFECPVCSKRFAQPQTLKMHLVSHNDVKPFQCNICGKGLARAHNLRAHMAIHRQNKPYSCERCSATFTLKGNLQRHHKEKHQGTFDSTGGSTISAGNDCGQTDDQPTNGRDPAPAQQIESQTAGARSAQMEQMISVDEEVSQSDEGGGAGDFERPGSPLNHSSVYASSGQQRQLGTAGGGRDQGEDDVQEDVDDGNDNDGRQSDDSLESEIDPVFDEEPEPTSTGELSTSQGGTSQSGLNSLGPSGSSSSSQQQQQSHQQQQQQPQQQTLFQPYASCTGASNIQQQQPAPPPASPELFHPHHHVPPLPASVFSQTINHHQHHHHVASMPMAVPPVHPFYHPHPHHPHHPAHPHHPGHPHHPSHPGHATQVAAPGTAGVSELSLSHAGHSLQLLHDTAAAAAVAASAAPCAPPVVVQHNVTNMSSDLGARLQAIHAALDELVQQGVVGVAMGASSTAVTTDKITAIHMAVDELVAQGPQSAAVAGHHTAVGHGHPGGAAGPCHPAHSLAVAVSSHPSSHITHPHSHHHSHQSHHNQHHHGLQTPPPGSLHHTGGTHNGGAAGGAGQMLDLRSAGTAEYNN